MNRLVVVESFRNFFALIAIVLATTTIISLASIASAVPSGPTPEASYDMTLDKTEYRPGETVTIKVINTFYVESKPVVTIRKATSNDDNNTISNYQTLAVVYREKQQLVNGTIEFKYQVPPADGFNYLFPERYFVELSESEGEFEYPLIKNGFFEVRNDGAMQLPLIFGIGAVIAGTIAFVMKRKRKDVS